LTDVFFTVDLGYWAVTVAAALTGPVAHAASVTVNFPATGDSWCGTFDGTSTCGALSGASGKMQGA
jgi:hypothetical protein